jgi:type IV pilus assembly protein PilW
MIKQNRFIALGNGGFTLVELMVALAMATFFIAVTFTLVDFSTQSYRAQERVAAAQQDMRAGIDIISREIRMAGYNPMRLSGAGIVTATADTFHFTMDMNRSNSVDETAEERVTYAFDLANNRVNRILYQGTGSEDSLPLIENVTAFNFTYFDESDNPTVTPADIKTVIITMTCSDRDDKGGTFDRTFNSMVNLRNLNL